MILAVLNNNYYQKFGDFKNSFRKFLAIRNRDNFLPSTVRTSRQRSLNKSVGCL